MESLGDASSSSHSRGDNNQSSKQLMEDKETSSHDWHLGRGLAVSLSAMLARLWELLEAISIFGDFTYRVKSS